MPDFVYVTLASIKKTAENQLYNGIGKKSNMVDRRLFPRPLLRWNAESRWLKISEKHNQ